jgi:RNA polymerase sigma-70 factor (ECF subfamily)
MALMLFHAARLERGSISAFHLAHGGAGPRQVGPPADPARPSFSTNQPRNRHLPFHLEAAIACLHCTAPGYTETDWPAILRLYDALLAINRSPVYLLNRAIVLAQIVGPHAGIRALDEAGQDPALRHYHLFDATLGEFYRRAGDLTRARQHFEAARQKTSSPCDRELINRRLSKCV